MSKYLLLSDAAYEVNQQAFCSKTNLSPHHIVEWSSEWNIPRTVIVVNPQDEEIVVVIRGSATLHDFCTDMILMNEPFQSGVAHRGIAAAAKSVQTKVETTILQLMQSNPKYSLHFTGHSLGAGIAALLALEMRQKYPQLHCHAFAVPACVSYDLASATEEFVTTLICGDDCVPRMHETSIQKLQVQVR